MTLNIVTIVKEAGAASYGLADLVAVRARLVGLSRRQQDQVIQSARRRGLITGSSREGRGGVTPEERAADLDDIGYLSIREAS